MGFMWTDWRLRNLVSKVSIYYTEKYVTVPKIFKNLKLKNNFFENLVNYEYFLLADFQKSVQIVRYSHFKNKKIIIILILFTHLTAKHIIGHFVKFCISKNTKMSGNVINKYTLNMFFAYFIMIKKNLFQGIFVIFHTLSPH